MRWWILSLVFCATTINYLDRIVFSVLATEIRKELHFDDKIYGYLTASFQLAYTVGFLFMGKLIDRWGTRMGYAVATAWWSIAAALHAFAGTSLWLGIWRAMLGLGESGNFPSAIKAVAEWFTPKDRAFATGIFNAGTNVASMIGPPLFLWMNFALGWRACFLITSSLGFIWLVFWLTSYRTPPAVPGEDKMSVGWAKALTYPETWGFAIAKFFTDPVWWFYLFWLPLYFPDVRKFELKEVAWALPFIYLMADVGSVAGGWFSGVLMRRGWTHDRARKVAMLVCAMVAPVAATGVLVENNILAVVLFSFATAAHQGWSANLFTTVSDVFPKPAVASVIGIGGCLGGLGGVVFSALIPGYLVGWLGYAPLFLVMSTFYLIALLLVHRLMGRMRPIAA